MITAIPTTLICNTRDGVYNGACSAETLSCGKTARTQHALGSDADTYMGA
jgi:hypothetical protein